MHMSQELRAPDIILRDLQTVLYFRADGGNSLGECEAARASRSRMNLESDRPYFPVAIGSIIG